MSILCSHLEILCGLSNIVSVAQSLLFHLFRDCLQPVLGGREGPEDMVKETSSGKRGDEPGVLSRLRQLECELTAIETRARTVEGELLASHQVRMRESG